jgi:hypothetical protein
MVIFGPWAFGTTETWSIWMMNFGGYLLGLMFAVKVIIRRWKRYHPPRWDNASTGAHPGAIASDSQQATAASSKPLSLGKWTALMAAATLALLAFTLAAALNKAAVYDPVTSSFVYYDHLEWLPRSFDAGRTWDMFWSMLALACAFWAVRDWLLGKAAMEERGAAPAPVVPTRLRRLLWLLALNGALLGLEGIAQRLEGSGKLLFLSKPRVNPEAETQFGPFAYRANAAAWMNLIWPLCLALWGMLQAQGKSVRSWRSHIPLICAVIIAACPIVSTSRGGALVALAMLPMALLFLMWKMDWGHRVLLVLFLLATVSLGFGLGWKALLPRIDSAKENLVGREEMYDRARPMAANYPVFGTGPGTFETVFSLYRVETDTYWPAQLHNDWLETRITFGWAGSGLFVVAGLLILLRGLITGGISDDGCLLGLAWLAILGCLVHARFDFPFQIYSIQFLVVLLCSILSTRSYLQRIQ